MIDKAKLKPSSYQCALEMQRIGSDAAHKAQKRNRAKGIPNYYSVGGRIISDMPSVESVESKLAPIEIKSEN
jgi:hypothetical protein